jgi:hypothetical protein
MLAIAAPYSATAEGLKDGMRVFANASGLLPLVLAVDRW